MITIRALLDALGDVDPGALERLVEKREVSEDALARSYRGDHAQFFDDLRKQDLARLLGDPTTIDGTDYWLPSATRYPRDELARMALAIFRDERVPAEFVIDGDEETDEGDEEADEGDEEADNAGAESARHPYSQHTRQDNTVYALVIGNQDYKYDHPLANPRKDASDFADAMRRLGHETQLYHDLTLREIDEVVKGTARQLEPSRGVVFYYSGHGAECNDDTWLIPIDCNSDDDDELERQAKSLVKIHKALSRARFRVTILDACRSNPFRGLARGDGASGLREHYPPMETPEGDYICFATAPRHVALDGRPGDNGPFTAALLKHLGTGKPITEIMIDVRRDVLAATAGKQRPWDHCGLTANWYPRIR